MVNPDHQRRRLDTSLLPCLCEESDRSGQFTFVMAALTVFGLTRNSNLELFVLFRPKSARSQQCGRPKPQMVPR